VLKTKKTINISLRITYIRLNVTQFATNKYIVSTKKSEKHANKRTT